MSKDLEIRIRELESDREKLFQAGVTIQDQCAKWKQLANNAAELLERRSKSHANAIELLQEREAAAQRNLEIAHDTVKKAEAERDALMKRVAGFDADRSEIQINAIKAATIERCAEVADKYWAREVASQIRGLKYDEK